MPSPIGVSAAHGEPLARSITTQAALRRREIAVQLGFMLISCGLTLAFVGGPEQRPLVVAGSLCSRCPSSGPASGFARTTRRLVGELRTLATRDALTGALNRGAFEEFLAAELARSRRYGRPLSLAALDLDHFKQVNDNHGHAAGDVVLRVVRLVAGNTRAGDVFARIGGEEFVLLLPDTAVEHAERLAETLRAHSSKTRPAMIRYR